MDIYSEDKSILLLALSVYKQLTYKLELQLWGVIKSSTAQFLAYNNLVDPQKYHIALGMVFGYFDETKPGTCYPRVRISQEEFAIIKQER
ncbi:hypothetical protein P344_01100 [Spiroplasma mirum ATCC 29335]|uniref:Nitroreductase domain-containing protein n=1 Tax=Spiroplasma mirum ATCC 29335 TaxID=838561 RepID=W6AK91_9MOLU|nr:hypothetical protein [Spiroplasma mirum]AHI57587.1 hypothetical protein P344_01100 [Spiroplasma mirum ATCC 29335]